MGLLMISFQGFSQTTQVAAEPKMAVKEVTVDLIKTSPTQRLKDYLQSLPEDFKVTEEWYVENIELYPLNDLNEEELKHFYKYMDRFSTYGNP